MPFGHGPPVIFTEPTGVGVDGRALEPALVLVLDAEPSGPLNAAAVMIEPRAAAPIAMRRPRGLFAGLGGAGGVGAPADGFTRRGGAGGAASGSGAGRGEAPLREEDGFGASRRERFDIRRPSVDEASTDCNAWADAARGARRSGERWRAIVW
jgi:hypothetical protein